MGKQSILILCGRDKTAAIRDKKAHKSHGQVAGHGCGQLPGELSKIGNNDEFLGRDKEN